MSATEPHDDGGKEEPLLEHLKELRDRLIKMVLSVFVFFVVLFPFSDSLYSWLADPLLVHMPEGSSMIAIEVASPFLIPFKLVLMLSIFLSVPVILYQGWAFVAPGLYRHEKRLVAPLMLSSTALFFVGVAFAYYVVFPLVFGFLTSIAPTGVEVATDIGRYLDFVITIFFAFGIAFEVPIAVFILIALGITDADSLAAKRPYFIVGAFVIGMLLTPPDVISQTLLALPMWLLFEAGIFFSRMLLKKEDEQALVPAAAASASASASESTTETANESSNHVYNDGGQIHAAINMAADSAGLNTAKQDDTPDPLTDEELKAELDRIEREAQDAQNKKPSE